MYPCTSYTHFTSYPPTTTYPQDDYYSDLTCNYPSTSQDNFDWGYESGPQCPRPNLGQQDYDYYPSQSYNDYRSSSFDHQTNLIYNQEGYNDYNTYPPQYSTEYRLPPSFEQPRMTYYQGGTQDP